jgi:hypothetical protein
VVADELLLSKLLMLFKGDEMKQTKSELMIVAISKLI